MEKKDLVQIVPDYSEKLGHLTATPVDIRDAESAGYAHYMAKMLAYSDAQREENRKLAEIRKKRHGIDPYAQQPSTLAIIARPKEKDEEHWNRPLPKAVVETSKALQAAFDAGDKDAISKLVAERKVTLEEVSHIEAIRRRPKNTIGQSEKSSIGIEKKEVAVNSFMFAPGIEFKDLTPEERQRVKQITQYTPLKPAEPEVKTQKKKERHGWIDYLTFGVLKDKT